MKPSCRQQKIKKEVFKDEEMVLCGFKRRGGADWASALP
jgi:hypothetical protein